MLIEFDKSYLIYSLLKDKEGQILISPTPKSQLSDSPSTFKPPAKRTNKFEFNLVKSIITVTNWKPSNMMRKEDKHEILYDARYRVRVSQY